MFNMQVNIIATNKVKERILDWASNEHAFFAMQKSFDIHIEKRPSNDKGETAIIIYFDNETNKILAKKLENRIVILDCIVKYDGLLATNIRAVHGTFPLKTNRRYSTKLQFITKSNNSAGMPIELHTQIRALPIAEERSEYVKKRIASWEGYLKIQERNANIEDITASFTRMDIHADFSRMTLICNGIKNEQWSKLKGLSVQFKGSKDALGDVLKVNAQKKTVEIELKGDIQELARKNRLQPKIKEVVFSNFATLSQIRRLRKGFADLEKGLAANANLEKILFEDRPGIRPPKQPLELEFHNPLNEFQREAVIGAMTAEDLYVIQGPPGTGKTTVISEICQQNAKAGLRTLVASQSNLAVDNALSRLLSNKDIRILRFGRTESIEEEGKKFIEENVGNYWLEQTLRAIKQEIANHATQKNELEQQMLTLEQQMKDYSEQKVHLTELLVAQQQAKIEHDELKQNWFATNKQIEALKLQQQSTEQQLEQEKNEFTLLTERIHEMEQLVLKYPSIEQLMEQLQQTEAFITIAVKQQAYLEINVKLHQIEQQQASLQQQMMQLNNQDASMQQLIENVQHMTKVNELIHFMEQHDIQQGYVITGQLKAIFQFRQELVAYGPWKAVNERLKAAIQYLEQHIGKQALSASSKDGSFSVEQVDYSINQVKQWLLTNGLSQHQQQLKAFLQTLYEQQQYVWKQGSHYQQLRQEILRIFELLKFEIIDQIKSSVTVNPMAEQSLVQQRKRLQHEYDDLKQQVNELQQHITTVNDMSSLDTVKQSVLAKQEELHTIQQAKQLVEQTTGQLAELRLKQQSVQQSIELMRTQINEETKQLEVLQQQERQQNERLQQLQEILEPNYELQLQQLEKNLLEATNQLAYLQKHLKKLPIKQQLQLQWYKLLEEANEHDLEEIRKLYIQHANVIGTTCVASARKEFMDNYPTFDVVIIDEVSKATPPELLLPMLKGKKIILVGDHHQLPPLIGDDTLEETLKSILEENSELEGREELQKLLKESLFERLFKNLPRSNKKMLAIQYRMHEKIMQTITPFYEQEDDYLRCGLTDSDTMRDHLLESHYVKRDDHLIWIDMPNERAFFEEQMKDGKSRYNQAELDVIRDLLKDLDFAAEMAKKAGKMAIDAKKSIGVISFYGEQVKKIDRLIQQEMNLEHLHLRTGTVDKFQGMEMDVILVSMVRNNDHKNADIGFANDYRRLNVALSRARELLILIGSTEMFTKKARQLEARQMYSRLLETVKSQQGIRTIEGAIIK